MERFWSKVDRSPGQGPNGDCWEWTACRHKDGYGHFGVGTAVVNAHRIAYELTFGELPSFKETGVLVRHRCDNPPCCNPDHLELGTQPDNVRDRDTRGRHVKAFGDRNGSRAHREKLRRGSAHGRAEVAEAQVLEMRALHDAGEVSQAGLSRRFGLSKTQVGRIVRREQWTHI